MDLVTPMEIIKIFEELEVRGDEPPKATRVVGNHSIQNYTGAM